MKPIFIIALTISFIALSFLNYNNNSSPKKDVLDTKYIQLPSNNEFTIIAAGDIACSNEAQSPAECRHDDTARLIKDSKPTLVLGLGDLQYNGSISKGQYDKSWGQFKDITKPVLGNHDYSDANVNEFFDYFSPNLLNKPFGYYSYDLGNWHIVALNSNCFAMGGCDENSEQVKWLKKDLEKNPKPCTLAYFHHPLFSSGLHGDNINVQDFWDILYKFHTDIVLNGHDHTYERFTPQNPEGVNDNNGIRQFIVGTGGRNLYPFNKISTNSAVRNNETFGVLKITLHKNRYEWEFLPVEGQTFTDNGNSRCHKK